MERFINILIIDDDEKSRKGLKEILLGAGNNILTCNSIHEAFPILRKREIGIVLINIDSPFFTGLDLLQSIRDNSITQNIYKIVLTDSSKSGAKMVRGLNHGAVDFITKPLNPNLVRAKIEVYKTLYYKDQRIGQLLNNIFPEQVLEDLNQYGKFSPKRVENGVVLFTDFVDFSAKAKNLKPLSLLKKLEKHFTVFDAIIERYHLEKIKTIGDSYMALAGVTENTPEPAIRACLAALEIRDYMYNEELVARALGRDFWQIRVGLNQGPLVAGIIGTTKYNFDVWGDTVNIAARAERVSTSGSITITKAIESHIQEFFTVEERGLIDIQKRGGKVEMFYLDKIKKEYCLYGEGKVAKGELRKRCGLSNIDFIHMRLDIINRLKALLPDDLIYHDISHTMNVEKACIRFAKLEGVSEEDVLLLRTAALYHDSGFILEYDHNEKFAIELAKSQLPRYGYSDEDIRTISNIIAATQSNVEPVTLLEKIMCDADHDYLGRPDYKHIANRLRSELENYGNEMNDEEWIDFQLEYLQNIHRFYTETALNIRLIGKKARILELKKNKEQLINKEE